ncbi:Na+/H+ antiporter NhaD [Desulfacinum hydrothermale DSM 13146]|uniref:Na+/H+ antiporter NhaD n=1 Tax=Desulfacinum hydrothermale DSM 13146 TaxID=1121390 RepID=A0A1W1XR11_9BACT|nr:SLC13 family permease [Desulfacinum hydrothermale]SMC25938.1 Na+/H+ antiporter NhaD [Desulfacinum hydrothermale DSM 13146]
MKAESTFIHFVLKEWLVVASGIGLVLTSVYIKHFPVYSIQELQVLFILFALFVAVNGLRYSGLILRIAQKIEKGKAIPLKLVVTTFFLSMLVTNDIALIVIVPLTLSLNINHEGILVILEALAANAGSALTPFGNPQNFFIYWFYGIHPVRFVETIVPFSLVFLIILIVSSLFVNTTNNAQETIVQKINKKAYIYGVLLFIVLLTVLHVLPVLTGILVFIFALIFDRKALYVDYALLFSFFFFFGLAENMKLVLASKMNHSGHIFLFSSLASQVMSNVPAALLFAKFTTNWEALLWGVNAGGFGSLFGSLANLIAYKIYVTHENTNNMPMFTAQFLIIGYVAFFLSIWLYFFFYKMQGL